MGKEYIMDRQTMIENYRIRAREYAMEAKYSLNLDDRDRADELLELAVYFDEQANEMEKMSGGRQSIKS